MYPCGLHMCKTECCNCRYDGWRMPRSSLLSFQLRTAGYKSLELWSEPRYRSPCCLSLDFPLLLPVASHPLNLKLSLSQNILSCSYFSWYELRLKRHQAVLFCNKYLYTESETNIIVLNHSSITDREITPYCMYWLIHHAAVASMVVLWFNYLAHTALLVTKSGSFRLKFAGEDLLWNCYSLSFFFSNHDKICESDLYCNVCGYIP